MTNESTWHIGYMVGVTLFGAAAGATLLAAIIFATLWVRDERYVDDWPFFTGVSFVAFLVSVACLGITLFPFDTSYHKYYKVAGEVQDIEHRLIKAGEGMAERYVFVIDGKPYAVDDTRATLTKEGDNVSLWCSKEYQYMGDSGWACEWGQQ